MPDRKKTLKEFDRITSALVDALILLQDQPDVVFCKDCKHRPIQTEPEKAGFTLEFPDYKCPCQCDDGYYSWYPVDDWFCADGERRDSDD